MAVHDHAAPMLGDFSVAFLVVAGLAMVAPAISTRLDPDAGAELCGRAVAAAIPPGPPVQAGAAGKG